MTMGRWTSVAQSLMRAIRTDSQLMRAIRTDNQAMSAGVRAHPSHWRYQVGHPTQEMESGYQVFDDSRPTSSNTQETSWHITPTSQIRLPRAMHSLRHSARLSSGTRELFRNLAMHHMRSQPNHHQQCGTLVNRVAFTLINMTKRGSYGMATFSA